jgi:UDP-xylose/UDP-N-acetylglucosamine transporter B4
MALSALQLSVMLVTFGIIVATASAPPKPKGKPPSIQHRPATTASTNAWGLADNTQYVIGVAILSLALVISAFMGLFQEKTYSKYGRGGAVWQESIFYSVSMANADETASRDSCRALCSSPQHALSLPLLVPFLSNISNDFAAITNTPPTVFRIPMPPGILPNKYPGSPTSNVLAVGIPSAWFAFAMNIFTQGLCINGVNRLTSVSSRWIYCMPLHAVTDLPCYDSASRPSAST